MFALFSSAEKARLITFSAYSGKVLRTEALPGPVSHIQPLEEDSAHSYTTAYAMASIRSPFPDSIKAFTWPQDAAVPEDRPVFFWAADAKTGALSRFAALLLRQLNLVAWQRCNCTSLFRLLLDHRLSHSQPRAQIVRAESLAG